MPPKRVPKKGNKSKGRKGASRSSRPSVTTGGRASKGFALTRSKLKGGNEDVELTTLVWESIYSTGLAANTDLVFIIKGNSINSPGGLATYGLGSTTNPVGYARLYTQYRLACVTASSIELSAWGTSGTISGGVPSATFASINVPLRLAVVPAQSTAAIVYFAENTATLGGAAHASTSFSNNVVRTRSRGNPGMFNTSEGKFTLADVGDGGYSAATGADPGITWNYVVGVGNASTALNATNLQVRVRVTYQVRWYQPVAAVNQLTVRDLFGNEFPDAAAGATTSQGAGCGAGVLHPRQSFGASKSDNRVESKGDAKTVVRLTQAEAFEDWSDVDSEFASFKEHAARVRRKARLAAASATTESPVVGSPIGLILTGGPKVEKKDCSVA